MIPVYADQIARDWLTQLGHNAATSDEDTARTVQDIIAQVAWDGDAALRSLAEKFGETPPDSFSLSAEAIQAAVERVPQEVRQIIQTAHQRITRLGQTLMDAIQPVRVEDQGFSVGLDLKAVEKVGCYVPGGRYPLPSTALMTAATARVAGVQEIYIVSPKLSDAVVYAGNLSGVKNFYQVGGAQAVAALAYGTDSIPRVDMVVGPGNAYVTEAKRQLQGRIGIDMLAGPSEVALIADAQADPLWVAKDMLAQAEHDPNARAYLLTADEGLAVAVAKAVDQLLGTGIYPDFMQDSILDSAVLLLGSLDECCDAANTIAPEHLQLHVQDPDTLKPHLYHYGALFMGYGMTVPFGDYMAGPNHTLPTGRTARFSGSLSPLTFLRVQSWMKADGDVSALARETAQFANLEGLAGHASAAQARLSQ
jgi:histidinol dehydrogenase